MKTMNVRFALLATIAASALVALLPSAASPFLAVYSGWSDRTKKTGIVPIEW
jgi:hypothetical protein